MHLYAAKNTCLVKVCTELLADDGTDIFKNGCLILYAIGLGVDMQCREHW